MNKSHMMNFLSALVGHYIFALNAINMIPVFVLWRPFLQLWHYRSEKMLAQYSRQSFSISGNFIGLSQLLKRLESGLATPLTIPSGRADVSHQVLWTDAPSGSLEGLEPDLNSTLGDCSFSQPLPLPSGQCVWSTWQWRKIHKSASAFSMSLITRASVSLQRGHRFFLLLLLSLACL